MTRTGRHPLLNPALIIVVALAALGYLQYRAGRARPLPACFDSVMPLDEANAKGQRERKPVLVFATAEWCGPCQVLKVGALADPRVTDWIASNMIAVALDADKRAADIRALHVQAFPTMMILREDRIVDIRVGVQGADALLEWLRASAVTVPATPAG